MHDLEFDHLHPNEKDREILREAISNIDNLVFTTVGVDVGSSTSHLMFAHVHLQRSTEGLSSRFVVVGRDVLWCSPIMLTPYRPDYSIDADALKDFIEQAYRHAGLAPSDIDSGAVILTGEALKRINARSIAELFADQAGKFVCASAGHHLEALMAAHGSGSIELSRVQHKTFLNVDIGGGTTKLALVHGGYLIDSSAIAVGGRLVAFDQSGRLSRIEEPAQIMAREMGLSELKLGARLSSSSRMKLVDCMVGILLKAIRREQPDPFTKALLLTNPLPKTERIDAITFSGGVSEYIYGRESEGHGDLGRDLAEGMSRALASKQINYRIVDPGQGIRATVAGASQYTVQVSGSTIYISDPTSLPMRNVPAIRLATRLNGTIEPAVVENGIIRALRRLDIDDGETAIALALEWESEPAYSRLYSLARGICLGLSQTIACGRPLILVTEGDIAQSLGRLLKQELNVPGQIVSLDGVQLREFDYIDIGALQMPANVVPIIIKSLLFSSSSTEHGHGHSLELHEHDHARHNHD